MTDSKIRQIEKVPVKPTLLSENLQRCVRAKDVVDVQAHCLRVNWRAAGKE